MERSDIEGALRDVAVELNHRGIVAHIRLVGGAAMVLEYAARESTSDVDASFHPNETVRKVAVAVGQTRGLPVDWLNDAAAIFIPSFKEPAWVEVMTVGTVAVTAADPRTLLAMKMRASRGQRDAPDLEVLLAACEIASVDAALRLYEEHFPEDPLPDRAHAMIDFAIEKRRET